MKELLLVVEGHGEVSAAPLLVRRLLAERLDIHYCDIETQRRRDIGHLRARDWVNFRRYVDAAYNEERPILWLLDCDDDCAKEIVHELTQQVATTNPRQPIAFALLPCEYETMFLYDIEAAKDSLPIAAAVAGPDNPKNIRGAKGWLDRHMPPGQIYKETVDQVKVTSRLNFELLEREYRDFRHLVSALRWLSRQTHPLVYPLKP
jgi:hypothetical protein